MGINPEVSLALLLIQGWVKGANGVLSDQGEHYRLLVQQQQAVGGWWAGLEKHSKGGQVTYHSGSSADSIDQALVGLANNLTR